MRRVDVLPLERYADFRVERDAIGALLVAVQSLDAGRDRREHGVSDVVFLTKLSERLLYQCRRRSRKEP